MWLEPAALAHSLSLSDRSIYRPSYAQMCICSRAFELHKVSVHVSWRGVDLLSEECDLVQSSGLVFVGTFSLWNLTDA